ncbi:hypothetical protein CYMTET_45730 [Cymbomonas tetramitiformis]|uniref:PX domain-containing protein n=1 Tax=Cymbomonas tetramitiformis TaxID=36881 RepID=A0AAE0BZ09_9CHLO|nr:hypothetical protein CYMTET_45730 [Cymbomonas tetramitiformis]
MLSGSDNNTEATVYGSEPSQEADDLSRQLDETSLPGDWGGSEGDLGLPVEGRDTSQIDTPPVKESAPPSYDDLLAPPSYADSVVFERGEIEPIGSEELSVPRRRGSSASKGVLEVAITEASKRDDESSALSVIGKKFVAYLVTTSTTLPGFRQGNFSVWRRFKDFVALADCLAESHRGYFIPQSETPPRQQRVRGACAVRRHPGSSWSTIQTVACRTGAPPRQQRYVGAYALSATQAAAVAGGMHWSRTRQWQRAGGVYAPGEVAT